MALFALFSGVYRGWLAWFWHGLDWIGLDWTGRYHSIIGIAIGVDEYFNTEHFHVYIAFGNIKQSYHSPFLY